MNGMEFPNTKVIRIDPAIGNSYRHVLYHFGKPRASLEYAKPSIFDFRPLTRVFDVSNFLPYLSYYEWNGVS